MRRAAWGWSPLQRQPARAAINLTGDVIPSPPVGDPWNVGGQLSIGETLIGSMAVNGGSDVSNADGYVGNIAGSDGTVTVSGAGSTWTNSGELRMGNSGTGTLNITGGGAVSVTGTGTRPNRQCGRRHRDGDGRRGRLDLDERQLHPRGPCGQWHAEHSKQRSRVRFHRRHRHLRRQRRHGHDQRVGIRVE